MATVRREEILAAFERCVARYGIEASLEQIADEAGIRRSLIRHYIGNREELVNSLIERITQDYPAHVAAAFLHTDGAHEVQAILDYLFRVELDDNTSDAIIVHVMMTAKERYPQAKNSLLHMFAMFISHLADALARAYPQAPLSQCQQIAYAIFCLAQTNESMLWVGFDQSHNQSARQSAELLLRSLASAGTQEEQLSYDRS
ncbi:MAG: TetR/AcrR family transcriptional regulator [Roseiflexaceae bacterium]|nr:TetR/AcrR family transcriptional regulator [Roseiflexaceae bacterium]